MSHADDRWDKAFGTLTEFARSHGHTRVPRNYDVDGFALGRWVHRQRQRQRDGTLDATRRARLQSLPEWALDRPRDSWEVQFGRLLDYLERHGNALVPYGFVTEDGSALGHWVTAQRTACSRDRLDPDRASRLANLPGWTWDVRERRWSRAFDRLLALSDRGELPNTPVTAVVDGFNIGRWIHNQRCTHARGGLSEDRTVRLEGVPGWSWNPFDDDWERAYGLLRDYVARMGDAKVPRGTVVGTFPLGVWVRTQRARHRAGTLPAHRTRRLEDCKGWV